MVFDGDHLSLFTRSLIQRPLVSQTPHSLPAVAFQRATGGPACLYIAYGSLDFRYLLAEVSENFEVKQVMGGIERFGKRRANALP